MGSNLKKNHIGEQNTTKYNQTMTIIKYVNSNNIDVQFDDGTIVKHKSYTAFKDGLIFNPNYFKNKVVGETNIAKNGQMMKIIDYAGSQNLTIEFEDGTIVTNKSYKHFKTGSVLNPNYKNTTWCQDRINRFAKKRIGEINIALNGMKMEIVAYRSAKDIDIQFEDGTIVKNLAYSSFQKGFVENPNYRIATSVSVNEFAILYYLSEFGFKHSDNNELKELGFGQMELDCYNSEHKIAIEYDGIWHNLNMHGDLKKNKLCKINNITLIRIREPKCDYLISTSKDYYLKSKDQLSQNLEDTLKEIIFYINSITDLNINIDVNFKRDASKIINEYRKLYKSNRVGQTNVANNGILMTIIAYRGTNDIDVKFEDGTVVKHQTYHHFKIGNVGNPNYIKLAKQRVGDTNVANNGQLMTLVEYRGVNDIDVQFEDGTIVKNRPYNCFKTGQIANPNYKTGTWSENRKNKFLEQRVGQTNTANNGQLMTIIAYRNANDIDVQFEDGTVVHHKTYQSFKLGITENPNDKISRWTENRRSKFINKRIGETILSNKGQKMTIIAYRNYHDIDIQFEDNTIVEHKSYDCFKIGRIVNPNFSNKYSRGG